MKIEIIFFILLFFTLSCKKEGVNLDVKSKVAGKYFCKGKVGYTTHTPPNILVEKDTTVVINVILKDDSTLDINPNLVNGRNTKAPIIGYNKDTLFFSYPSHSVSFKNFIYKNMIYINYAEGRTSISYFYNINGSKIH